MHELNDSQKRFLASTFATVEAYLKDIGDLMEQGLDPKETARLGRFMQKFQAEADAFKQQFELPTPGATDRRWSLYTHLEFMNVELMELTRSRLAGYGALDDDTYMLLNDRIDQLMKLSRDEVGALRQSR